MFRQKRVFLGQGNEFKNTFVCLRLCQAEGHGLCHSAQPHTGFFRGDALWAALGAPHPQASPSPEPRLREAGVPSPAPTRRLLVTSALLMGQGDPQSSFLGAGLPAPPSHSTEGVGHEAHPHRHTRRRFPSVAVCAPECASLPCV